MARKKAPRRARSKTKASSAPMTPEKRARLEKMWAGRDAARERRKIEAAEAAAAAQAELASARAADRAETEAQRAIAAMRAAGIEPTPEQLDALRRSTGNMTVKQVVEAGPGEPWFPPHPLTPDEPLAAAPPEPRTGIPIDPTPEEPSVIFAQPASPLVEAAQAARAAEPALVETPEEREQRRQREQAKLAQDAWLERERQTMRAELQAHLEEEGVPPREIAGEIERRMEGVLKPAELPPEVAKVKAEIAAREDRSDEDDGTIDPPAERARAITILRRWMAFAGTRMADGRISSASCQLCEQTGVHGRYGHCKCPCHEAQRFLAGIDRAAREGAATPARVPPPPAASDLPSADFVPAGAEEPPPFVMAPVGRKPMPANVEVMSSADLGAALG